MAKDLACVEGSRRNTGKEVVITEKRTPDRQKEEFKDNYRALSLVEPIEIHFPLRRSGRTSDKQRGEKDHQRLTRALVYSCVHISHSGLD